MHVEDAMRWWWCGLCAVVLAIGCSKPGSESGKGAPGAAATAAAHAPADVKPGSYEDWCGEHGVPESACTKCNADLVPEFKKKGDWCEKHSLPKSQCIACDPALEAKLKAMAPAGK